MTKNLKLKSEKYLINRTCNFEKNFTRSYISLSTRYNKYT